METGCPSAQVRLSTMVVSALVTLTVMVTTLANLVYVQSRFVDQPEGADWTLIRSSHSRTSSSPSHSVGDRAALLEERGAPDDGRLAEHLDAMS